MKTNLADWDLQQHLHSAPGLTKQIDRYSVGLLHLKGETPMSTSAGTCVQIGSKFFIATAAHVLVDVDLDDLIVVPQGGPYTREARVPFLASGSRGGGKRDPIDVAFLEVDERSLTPLDKEFLPVSRIAPCKPPNSRGLVVWGAPSALIDAERFQRTKNVIVRFLAMMTCHIPAPANARDPDPDADIFLDYDQREGASVRSDGAHQEVPAADGFSGGGIWEPGLDDVGLWSPEKATLVGIQHAWAERDRFLRGTQIHHWLHLVADSYVDLQAFLPGFGSPK